jgi:hypothetical protein
MCHSVVSHVNSTVRQRLNQIPLVEWDLCPQPERSRATPFVNPINSHFKFLLNVWCICSEILQMPSDSLLPFLIGIIQIPLIDEADNTFLTRSRNDPLSWFIVNYGFTNLYQILFDQVLGIFNNTSSVLANQHLSLIKALFVAQVLGLCQQGLVILTFDL